MRRTLATLMPIAPLLVGADKVPQAFKYGTWSPMTPFTASTGGSINYYRFSPTGAKTGEKPLPLVVWLHGGLRSNGHGGPNLPQQAFYRDEHQGRHPAFVLRPVAIQGRNWVSPRGAKMGSHRMPDEPSASVKVLRELIREVVRAYPVDTRRVYVVGASMGGYGIWDLVQRHPETFAAAVPICGGGDPSLAGRIKEVPLWIFHGDRDPFVPVKASREMFTALLKARGGEPVAEETAERIDRRSPDGRIRYTEYKGGNHNAAWERGLADPELVEWVFAQARRADAGRPLFSETAPSGASPASAPHD